MVWMARPRNPGEGHGYESHQDTSSKNPPQFPANSFQFPYTYYKSM